MPDVVNRDAKEAALAKAVSKEFSIAVKELLILFPEMEEFIATVPIEFWTAQQIALVSAIAPSLTAVFVAQAETMMDGLDFLGVDWALVDEVAVDWSSNYTFKLVTDINSTSRAALQKLIPSYFEQGWTQGQLTDRLSSIYGPKRASLISRTEVTRAASEGEVRTAEMLMQQGITMRPIWQTRNDELVCPICGPLHGLAGEFEGGNGRPFWIHPSGGRYGPPPDSHPNCRCWWGQELISTV